MKRSIPLFVICGVIVCFSSATAQTDNPGSLRENQDTTYSTSNGYIDSLKTELKGIEHAYYLFKARVDTTKELTDADRQELQKLSDSLEKIGQEIRGLSNSAAQLADDAANIYDIENLHIEKGDYTLSDDQTVSDNIEVLNGDAFVYGTIKGSILVVNGDAFIRSGAKIDGDVIVVNGKAHVSEEASVSGNVIEREGSDLQERHGFVHGLKFAEHPDIWQNHDFLFDHLAANYNRVDGIFLGLGSEKDYFWDGADALSPYGFLGYAFNLHRWRGQFGIDKWFGNEDRFEVGAEGHSLTDSKDSWAIGPKENSVYSILAKEDFMDYFSRQGASFHAAQYYQMNSRITLSYDVDEYSTLPKTTKWSLFGGNKVFRDNPAIGDGWMRSFVVDIEHRSYTGGDSRKEGWVADLRGETTVSGAFDFRMATFDAARYQPVFTGLQLNMRLRAGTSSGVLPLQRSYQLGGFNSLNAFPLKAFPSDSSGNRMLLLNLEFLFSPDMFKHSSFFPLNTFTLILFSDVGEVQDAGPSAGLGGGWNTITASGFKSDYGIGFGSSDGTYRIFLAWRTDVAALPTFGIRLARPF
jgi:hypothetical protein